MIITISKGSIKISKKVPLAQFLRDGNCTKTQKRIRDIIGFRELKELPILLNFIKVIVQNKQLFRTNQSELIFKEVSAQ